MKTVSRMKGTVAATLSALLLASVAVSAAAQDSAIKTENAKEKEDEKAQKVETVTVTTGTRTAKAVDKIPGAITIVSKEEVAHTLAITQDATAVLARSVPGYAESSQAMSNSGETLRGRTALRLFDGIPQTSPLREGNRSGTFTDMGIIARIEVINGPSASEGIGASGGIINYISAVPTKNGNEFTLTTNYSTQFRNDSESWKLGFNFAHKEDAYDLLLGTSFIDRGVGSDANGRKIGLNTSGSTSDSEAKNLFVKVGGNFGDAQTQRLQFTLGRFNIAGKSNYMLVDGDRATGLPSTAVLGQPLGSKSSFNNFNQYSVAYTNDNLFGGAFKADYYRASQAMRFEAEDGADRQDPAIKPLGTLIDQSEINSQKKGVRTSWTAQNFLTVPDLELRAGLDLVQDETQQKLALTDRIWVPPILYKSTAPYVQGSYDIGPVTLSAGVRREDGKLSVETYRTTFFRNAVLVQGGTLDYKSTLPNYGVIWRIGQGWSVFGAYGKGFSLPNIGIPLRNVSVPGKSVATILDLQAIIVDNKEFGFNWRGQSGSISGSMYNANSALGVTLSVDPVTRDFVLNRRPIETKGIELSGEYILSKELKFGALYSRIRGKTSNTVNGPLEREMGVSDINPDKIAGSGTWKYSARGDLRLGFTTLRSRDINAGRPGEEHTKGYTLFDLSANYDFKKWGTLSLGVENLTNKFYFLSWSQVDFFRNYFAGRGRVTSLTHTLKF